MTRTAPTTPLDARRSPRYYPILRGLASRNRNVLIVADLSDRELEHRLAGPGLRLRTGPVVARIQSRLPVDRPRDCTPLRGIPDRRRRELRRFPRARGQAAQPPPMAAAAGAIFRRRQSAVCAAAARPGLPDARVGAQLVCFGALPPVPDLPCRRRRKVRPRADPSGTARVRQEHAVRGPRQSWLATPVRRADADRYRVVQRRAAAAAGEPQERLDRRHPRLCADRGDRADGPRHDEGIGGPHASAQRQRAPRGGDRASRMDRAPALRGRRRLPG